MRTWLRLVVDSILGKVRGKTSRLDTATKMAMAADFSDRHESPPFVLSPGASETMDGSLRLTHWRTLACSRSSFASSTKHKSAMPKMNAGYMIPCSATDHKS